MSETKLEKISPERAGELALKIICDIYARRGLDLRVNQYDEWRMKKAKEIRFINFVAFTSFTNNVIVPALAGVYADIYGNDAPKKDFTLMESALNGHIALLMLRVENLTAKQYRRIIEDCVASEIGSEVELISLFRHYVMEWQAERLSEPNTTKS